MSTRCFCWQETHRQADAAADCNALSGKTSPVFLIGVWRIVDGDQFNVTGFGDEAHQFVNGQLQVGENAALAANFLTFK